MHAMIVRLATVASLFVSVSASRSQAAEWLSKKDRARAEKSMHHAAVPAAGAKPAPLVNIYNQHTREWLAVDARYPTPNDAVLRCHFTNRSTRMDPRLLATIVAAAVHFRTDVVHIVSAFRDPKFNLYLRKKGREVARDSMHTRGQAIDFFIPKVAASSLYAWAKARKLGGVGVYRDSGFVHIDTGQRRVWSGE
jgi:uncharacterized protein YcbK (DUF882 family)